MGESIIASFSIVENGEARNPVWEDTRMSYDLLLEQAYNGECDVDTVVAKMETLPPAPPKRRHRKTGGCKGNRTSRAKSNVSAMRRLLDQSDPLTDDESVALSAFMATCNERDARLLSYSGRGEARGGRLAKREVIPVDVSQVWAGRSRFDRIRPPSSIKLILHPSSGFAAHVGDNGMEYATDRGFEVIVDYPPVRPLTESIPDVTACGLFTAPPAMVNPPLPRVDSHMLTKGAGALPTQNGDRYPISDSQTGRARKLLPHILRALQSRSITPDVARDILARDSRPLPTVCPKSVVVGE